MELKYYRCGDYFFPGLGLTEDEQRPIGKYGQMRMEYLRKNRHGLFTRLFLSGKLMDHLHEIDDIFLAVDHDGNSLQSPH